MHYGLTRARMLMISLVLVLSGMFGVAGQPAQAATPKPTPTANMVVPATGPGGAFIRGCKGGKVYRYVQHAHINHVNNWQAGTGEVPLVQREVANVYFWRCKHGATDNIKVNYVRHCFTWVNGPGPNSFFYYGNVVNFHFRTEGGGHEVVPNFRVKGKHHRSVQGCRTRVIPVESRRWWHLRQHRAPNITFRMGGYEDWAPVVTGGNLPFHTGNRHLRISDSVYLGRVFPN